MEPKPEFLSYDKIIKDCKNIGIEVTWRKLNYYKSLGLLPKPVRMGGDKRGYYPPEITNDLILYYFLQNDIGFTLKEIKELRDDFRIVDENLVLRDSPSYSVAGNFAYIINVTYAAYLKTFINDPESGQYFRAFGANSIIMLNQTYKYLITQFRKTILPSTLKEGTSRKSYENHIKEWGQKAARTVSKEVASLILGPQEEN